MSGGYPVEIDVARVPVLVVGGGRVATRKVDGLVEAGGRPTVIAPDVTARIEALGRAGAAEVLVRAYREGDEDGFVLVLAATDDREVNARVAERAEAAGALVNVANVPGRSTFRVPAVLRRGPVTIACSTGGGSPLLARHLRDRVGRVVTPGVGRGAARLAALREQIPEIWSDEPQRRAFWFELLSEDFLDALFEGREEEVEHMIERCLSRSSA